MASPDATLVDAWDRTAGVDPRRRALALVEALAGLDDGALTTQPLGAGAAVALETAARWFGPELEAVFACSACSETMELSLAADDLLATAPAGVPSSFETEIDGRSVVLRPPRPVDVAAASASEDAVAAARLLLNRSVLSAEPAPDERGEAFAAAVEAALAAEDPLGVVSVDVVCPACGTPAAPVLDPVRWCWTAAEAHVLRLLDEVDALARAYGWSEAEILALSSRRRGAYLELVA